MSHAKKLYLGRHGKIFGPFDAKEIECLQASLEIRKYSYLWDPSDSVWKAIEPPPPDPKEFEKRRATLPFEVICHDSHFSAVAGRIRNVSEDGCDVVTDDNSDIPRIGIHSPLVLNVLDPRSKRSINIHVRMSEAQRQDGRWVFCVRWKEPVDLKSLAA